MSRETSLNHDSARLHENQPQSINILYIMNIFQVHFGGLWWSFAHSGLTYNCPGAYWLPDMNDDELPPIKNGSGRSSAGDGTLSSAKRKKIQSSGANRFRFFLEPGSRFLSVRMRIGGKRRRFSTGETSIKKAQSKAAAIMADIKSRGFEEATKLHSKRRDEIPVDPTIDEFASLYRVVIATADAPPNRTTSERYIRCLERVCEGAGVTRVRRLNAAAVEKFKDAYLRKSLPAETGGKSAGARAGKSTRKREASGVRTTLNGILRQAAAMFSQSLMAGYLLRGLDLENPFAGTKLKRIAIKAHAPFPRELIENIWKSAFMLRDGDSTAPAPTFVGGRRSENATDFREPHTDAYAILLLELGLGLRRNEADKAEWSWVIEMPDGRRFLQVRETDIFTPKSKQSRVIPIDPLVWIELMAVKADNRFIVPAPERKPKRKPKGKPEAKSSVYRNEEAHRVLVRWLKKVGVQDAKPCHALRKEFGSYVATTFSLFHAQKLLGHSTPAVTSAYYASLTDLPELQPTRMGQPKQ